MLVAIKGFVFIFVLCFTRYWCRLGHDKKSRVNVLIHSGIQAICRVYRREGLQFDTGLVD